MFVIITGATSGIGYATAHKFAGEGHHLVITGRRTTLLQDLSEKLEDLYNIQCTPLAYDVRDFHECERAMKSLGEEALARVDVLVNNAGLAKGLNAIHEGRVADWDVMIDTNVKGTLHMTRIISPYMVARRKGHIINVCSSAGKEVYPKGNVYCATKSAVDALTRSMRLDLHKYGLRISQVSPGHVEETEFARVRFDWDEEQAKIYEDFQPLKAADVAKAIYYIASQPEHVNIQDIVMFGTQQASNLVIDRSGRTKHQSM